MSVRANYNVYFDIGRDNTYTSASPSADVSNYVLAMQWQEGMADSYALVARPCRLQLDLLDPKGDFRPEKTTAKYYGYLKRGMLIKVTSTFQGTTRTHFIGKLVRVEPVPELYTERPVMRVTAEDPMLLLLSAEYNPVLSTNVTVDAAITTMFDSGVIAYPYEKSYWLLDYSTLDTNTTVFENTITNFETAYTTLAYVGDNMGKGAATSNSQDGGQRAQSFIRELLASEAGGRLWWDGRTGKFKFHNRYHDALATSSFTMLASQIVEGDYRFADDQATSVTVNFEQRQVGTPASVLWTHDSVPFAVAPGASRKVVARYRDPTAANARVGATDVITPFYGTDWTANLAEDGSGADAQQHVGLSIIKRAGSAEIVISNAALAPAVYIQSLQLRGTPLTTFNRGSVNVRDANAIADFGVIEKIVDVKAVDDEEFAIGVAGLHLARFREQRARFATHSMIANTDVTLMTRVLAQTIGDRYTLDHSVIGHNKDYTIVGAVHKVRIGDAHEHQTTWVVKPAERELFWILQTTGFGELDDSTALAL